jgi:hypothetical protein
MFLNQIFEGKNPCWDNYKRVPGTKKYAPGSCEKMEEAPVAPAPTTPPAPVAQAPAKPAAPAPAANPGQQADQIQQRMLDKMGARFGLPPGSTIDQVQAAQQAHLDKNDPNAAAQYRQNMTNIDAGNTAATKPVQLAPKAAPAAPAQDPDTAAGLAAAKAGKNPTEIMLAQPYIASAWGLPAGSTVDQIKAAVAKPAAAPGQPAPAYDKAAVEQKAIDDIAVKQGLPTGLTKDQFFKAYQEKLNKQYNLPAGFTPGAAQPAAPAAAPAPVAENQGRAVDKKGRTQAEWIKAVYKAYPDARIAQAKMIDGPCHAMLPDGRKFSWVKDHTINELSNNKLDQYKKAAGADASAADKRGDYERGNKRFKGINRATVKQFDNDAKRHK